MSSNMSWNQPPPQQRYSAVPGFERQATPSSQLPSPPPRAELDNNSMGSDIYSSTPPPAHRASPYADPFTGGSTPSVASNVPRSDSMNTFDPQGRPPRSNYAQMGEGAAYGAGAGAGAGAAGYGAYSAANQGYPTQQGYTAASPYDNDHGHGFSAHDNVPSDQLWALDSGKERVQDYSYNVGNENTSSKKKWWIIGGILGLIVIACAVAIPVAITTVNNNKKSSGSHSNSNGTAGMEDPNDPSKFTPDSRLHKVFWGMAYQPDGVIPPMCGATQEAINRDMQILSQLTPRLRLYGGNCNCTIMVMEAIKQTKVEMEVYPAIYLDDNNEQAFTDQLNDVVSAFKTYGVKNIGGLAVGNEYLLGAGIQRPTGSQYTSGLTKLNNHIQIVRDTVAKLNLDKTIPIGTGDAGSLMSVTLAEMVDFFMANVHPWFGSVLVEEAADWTYSYFQENDVAPALKASNKPTTYIAETGWPTAYMKGGSESQVSGSDPSNATPAQLQTFLDTYVCAANANGTGYFYFEPFDQPWKDQYGGVEPYWGLFDKDRKLKDITIPSTCLTS